MSLRKFTARLKLVRWFCMICGVAITALGLTTISPQAATLHVNGAGQLTGASNVDLGSLGFYNVSFLNGSCIGLFDGCDEVSDFTFANAADAITAAQALLNQVFIDNHPSAPSALFDTDPSLTNGCDYQACKSLIPFSPSNSSNDLYVSLAIAFNKTPQYSDAAYLDGFPKHIDTINYYNTYAVFTSAVPLPAALPLFGAGLAIMGFLGWRKQRKAAA